jgi:hypothetical protein
MAITNDKLPWLRDVNVFMTPISHTNWNINDVVTSMIRNGRKRSSGAQNDEINFDVTLAAGTWTIEILHNTSTDLGIYSVQLDGVEVGIIDGYAGTGAYNVRGSVTGVSVSSAGKKRLKLKMATKNASSSNYYGSISHIQLRRTA